MLLLDEARAKALAHLQATDRASWDGSESVILDDCTQTHGFGWVFFYQNRRYLETGDLRDAYAGNAPLLVNRHTGALHVTGTAHPLGYYLANYRITGDPHRIPVWNVVVDGCLAEAQVGTAVCLARDAFGLPLPEAKRAIDGVLAGAPASYRVENHEAAERAAAAFRAIGFTAQVAGS